MSWNTGLSLAGEEVQSSHGWAVTIYPPRRPTAGGLGGQAWVSQERQVALGLTTHMGVHYHPLIRAQGPGL